MQEEAEGLLPPASPLCCGHWQGAGEKDGLGRCECHKGYEGDSCELCSKGFYNLSETCIGEVVLSMTCGWAILGGAFCEVVLSVRWCFL